MQKDAGQASNSSTSKICPNRKTSKPLACKAIVLSKLTSYGELADIKLLAQSHAGKGSAYQPVNKHIKKESHDTIENPVGILRQA